MNKGMAPRESEGMTPIIKTVALALAVPITVFGLYIIAHGHLTPGGGFPGGAVIATLVALFLIAFGKDIGARALNKKMFSGLETVGLVGFALLALEWQFLLAQTLALCGQQEQFR